MYSLKLVHINIFTFFKLLCWNWINLNFGLASCNCGTLCWLTRSLPNVWCNLILLQYTHEFESCILLLREEETHNLTIVKLCVWSNVKQVKLRILSPWKNLKKLKLKGRLIIVCSLLAKTSWRLYCLSIVFCKELETIDRQTVLVTAGRWRHNRRIVQFPQNLFLAA